MAHKKKKQSTGNWKKNRDKHQNIPKTVKEKKRQKDSWKQKDGKKRK